MVDKDKILTGKIFGILSIVFAFISSWWGIGGIVLGIIGLNQIKKEKKKDCQIERKLNILGIVFGSIILVLSLVFVIYMMVKGGFNASSLLAQND